MLQDHDGKRSLSRAIAILLITLYIIIAVWHYAMQHVFIDIPPGLATLILALYAANRGAQVALEALARRRE